MKATNWNPKQFTDDLSRRFSKAPDSPSKHRAFQAAEEFLRSDQRKVLREWKTFHSFCRCMDLEPTDIIMLDPNSSSPPPPDLTCKLNGEPHYFELAEIIQQDFAEASSPKNQSRPSKPNGPVSKDWDTFVDAVTKKLEKTYSPDARPRSLLLYYDQSESFWKHLLPVIDDHATQIRESFLTASTFDYLFVYDLRMNALLLFLSIEQFMLQK